MQHEHIRNIEESWKVASIAMSVRTMSSRRVWNKFQNKLMRDLVMLFLCKITNGNNKFNSYEKEKIITSLEKSANFMIFSNLKT